MCYKCCGIDPEKVRSCFGCSKSFKSGERKVGMNDEYFHEKCFVCSKCQQPIGSNKCIRKSDGRRLCNSCFKSTAKVHNWFFHGCKKMFQIHLPRNGISNDKSISVAVRILF